MTQFISVSDDGKYFVTDEARYLLGDTLGNTEITPITIVGLMRSGKSSIMNELCGKMHFATSANVQAKTQGMGCTPVKHTDGRTFLMIDTEGLSSPNRTKHYDMLLFTFSLLFSAKICINLFGSITSGSLDDIQAAGEVAERMKRQAKKFGDNLPELFWILRDFSLNLVSDQGDPITATQYVEQSLEKLHPDFANSIKRLFPQRMAIGLVRPCIKESDLAIMRNILPAFKTGLSQVKQNVFSTKQKMVGSVPMTGALLLTMAETYCSLIVDKTIVPEMDNVWTAVTKVASERARFSTMEHISKVLNSCSLDICLTLQPQVQDLPKMVVKHFSESLLEPPQSDQVCDMLQTCKVMINDREAQNLDQWKKFNSFSNFDEKDIEKLDPRSAFLCQGTIEARKSIQLERDQCITELKSLQLTLKELEDMSNKTKTEICQNHDRELLLLREEHSNITIEMKDKLLSLETVHESVDTISQEKMELEQQMYKLQAELTHFQQTYNESESSWESIQKQAQESQLKLVSKLNEGTRQRDILEKQLAELSRQHESDDRVVQNLKKQLDDEKDMRQKMDTKCQQEISLMQTRIHQEEDRAAKRLKVEEIGKQSLKRQLEMYKDQNKLLLTQAI